ncbi:DUF3087 domain-containing protein [Vibrio rarus]|uniref:DUF3087 domain-containing protein n=1 Tax=Vibrio rarus TaxID=413403 RepID=UPI0021C4B132|nr:DUF3087 domain-containing protein [Vibrio rarus]
MQLKKVDKRVYRSRLNVVIVACVGCLAILSLSISQVLIQIFPSGEGTHFHWNLLGVVVAAGILGLTLMRLKTHSLMVEVAYVWDLKQALNLIYRKNRKLLLAAKQGNKEAMLALQFSYEGSRQLWTLDDNTITMDSLNQAQLQLDEWVELYGVQLDITQYQSEILKKF